MDQVLRDFGARVKALRQTRNWTQQDLASRAGLHRTYIGSIERSERNVSLLNVARIAEAFEVSVVALLETDKNAGRADRADE